jgi:hypothetical protein
VWKRVFTLASVEAGRLVLYTLRQTSQSEDDRIHPTVGRDADPDLHRASDQKFSALMDEQSASKRRRIRPRVSSEKPPAIGGLRSMLALRTSSSGTTSWKYENAVLALSKVADKCEDRVKSLVSLAWKQKD